MQADGRLYVCVRCRRQEVVCRRCDRGQRYCAQGCAQEARRESVREAGRRFGRSAPGRAGNTRRQREWRQRQRVRREACVTHQGSAPWAVQGEPLPAVRTVRMGVASRGEERHVSKRCVQTPRCAFCGGRVSTFLRLDALRHRSPRRVPDFARRE